MKFYSFEQIRAVGDCASFARDVFGVTISSSKRCAALWRDGTNTDSVSIDKEKWYDHAHKTGGGIIELASIKFGGDTQQTQAYLGEYYNLTPSMETGSQPAKDCRFERLKRDGYTEIKRYPYNDIVGNLVHFVSRLEHPTKPKEFCQGTPCGWGLKGVEPVLYNLAGIASSDWCCVVEGEKAADILIHNNIAATTCCGGAKKWHSGYAQHFAGKDVVILPDNDEPGLEHAQLIAASITATARTVRIVRTSDAPKGDVHDYLIDERNTVADLCALISCSPNIVAEDVLDIQVPEPESVEVKSAKEANAIPLRNFIPIKQQPDPKRRNAKPQIERKPRLLQDLIDEAHERFLGFPRKVGEHLFDHDRDTGEIVFLSRTDDLFAWLSRKSKHQPEWARGDSLATKSEFVSGLRAAAIRYEATSPVPDWPKRSDVYYSHDALPPPCPNRSRFLGLAAKFAPATDADAVFLRAFLVAPLWYINGTPRPSWIIDSDDGAGTGKTTLAEIAAYLYGSAPIRTHRQELERDMKELVKRIVSASGRERRILLVDNVTGKFSCSGLADLITASSISGKSPYGRGEETRPNNLMFVITANTATVDNDIADRSLFIKVKQPPRDPHWKQGLMSYIDKLRFEIIADIIDMLERNNGFDVTPKTRFPEFEASILQAVCADQTEYNNAINHLGACREDTNIDEEHALIVHDTIRERLAATPGVHPDDSLVFIRSDVMKHWITGVLERDEYTGGLPQYLRNLVNMRLIPAIDSKTKRYPHHGNQRRSGFMWDTNEGVTEDGKEDTRTVAIMAMRGKTDVEVVNDFAF